MPGLAELILAGKDEEDELAPAASAKCSLAALVLAQKDEDDDALEDPELARELATVKARTAALQAELHGWTATPLLAAVPDAVHPTPSEPAPVREPVLGSLEASVPEDSSRPSSAGQHQRLRAKAQALARSLEEEAPGPPGSIEPVDRELETMERELERQVREYRGRCQGGSEVPPPPPATSVPPGRPRATAQSCGAGGVVAAPAVAGGFGTSAAEASPEATEAELLVLRSVAAKLDEVFPETSENVAEPVARSQPKRPYRTFRFDYRQADRDSATMDADVGEAYAALDELEVRLRAIQSRGSAFAEAAASRTTATQPEASRAILEMQAQNKHLRERMAAADGKGLWQLDWDLFGAINQASSGSAGQAATGSTS